MSLCYRRFRFFIGRIFLFLALFSVRVSRGLGVGNCVLSACPGVRNRTLCEKKISNSRGCARKGGGGGGLEVLTAGIEARVLKCRSLGVRSLDGLWSIRVSCTLLSGG